MSSSSNEPLADVQIFLPIAGNPAAAAARADAVSDAGGNFVITNVPVGRLILRAQIAGYFASPVDGVTPVALRVPVTVVADQGIVVKRPKSASLSISAELAARATFLATLHRESGIDKWVERIVRERVEIEESAFTAAKKALAS